MNRKLFIESISVIASFYGSLSNNVGVEF